MNWDFMPPTQNCSLSVEGGRLVLTELIPILKKSIYDKTIERQNKMVNAKY